MEKTSVSASISIKAGNIAKIVLMPGDPLRAKYLAEQYLKDPVCFNSVRNMLGYTGSYKGKQISVMGSGMGIPSMGLYATELYTQFDVDYIIRIGSAGSLLDEIHLHDVVIAMAASSDSSYGDTYGLPGHFAPVSDYGMLSKAVDAARALKIHAVVGPVYSCDHFYYDDNLLYDKARFLGHMAVEMETAGLYWTAAFCHKKALSILTISDHIYTKKALTAMERQESFHEMMSLALETACLCNE